MGRKILVVEDSTLISTIIKNFIKEAGDDLEVIHAYSGEDGIERYIKEKPDLVFMDIMMQGIDGITATGRIISIDPNAKIIICSSQKKPEIKLKARQAGCVDFISKPFSEDDISEVINKYLN